MCHLNPFVSARVCVRTSVRCVQTSLHTYRHAHLTFSKSFWHLQGWCEGARTAHLHNDGT